jgi:predicted  nucleic acid-binding Zn-ribbon protein
MSQTKRFLESIEAEQDYLIELHAKIETTVAALCEGDDEKLKNIRDAIRRLESQSKSLSRNVWLDLEPKIKKENSELLSLVENLISVILLSECDKWFMKK